MEYLIVDERSGSRVTSPCVTDQSIDHQGGPQTTGIRKAAARL
jgi:hypothetical protein